MKIIRDWGLKEFIKQKSKKSLGIALIVAIALTGGTTYWLQRQSADKSSEPQYEQAQVKKEDIIVGLDSDGTIDFSKVKLRFGVRGTIAEILVAEGDEIQKGQIIARLDDRDYQDQYQLALAKLQDAQDDDTISLLDSELKIKSMEADLEKLRDEYKEMETISDAYSTNELKMKKLELDNKEMEYQNLLKKYQLDKSKGLDQNELQVKMAKEDLEDTIVYAPVSGVLLNLANKAGESLTDEDDFATIHENKTIKAITKVIEYDIGQIKVGQKVYVNVEALPDKKFTGVVSKINALPEEDSSGLVNYSVEMTIKDPGPELKDGMTCSVSFVLKEVADCLTVPYKAVKMVNGKQMVTVVDEKGQQVERQIKTGFTDGTSVEVLEGLKNGETVIYAKPITTKTNATQQKTNSTSQTKRVIF
ncbi:efflux transporter, RND family, MFP subunit [Desulforamulus reducens MI-1]|uniref:Efflux transporter, RND family, MFP subunit n=1 Tax=Desulforamulus reducens (strain ATCC BAA-1160 / DSM 100696 / MI-1) TaxID=349161 RepID=A4J1B4_DESRM|nr:efflux RND transporter periplasmic adaptor subunit [Desulforamulus reducens]ABO48867.1 efflux transporter, RND family, MFP subunit [Desulforamulus reducens MI-1]